MQFSSFNSLSGEDMIQDTLQYNFNVNVNDPSSALVSDAEGFLRLERVNQSHEEVLVGDQLLQL